MAELRIRPDEGDEVTVVLDERPFTFGRGEGCDFVLDEQRASRRHCTFHPCGEGWRVEDDQSSNGTWLGGRPVLSARLQPGDEIEIGRTVIVYEGRAVAAAPAAVRPRRGRSGGNPWRALVVPVVLAIGAFAAVAFVRDLRGTDASKAWTRYVRASLPDDRSERLPVLARLERELTTEPHTDEALRLVRNELAEARAATTTDKPAPVVPGSVDDWRGALAGLDAAGAALPVQERRLRLMRLLERNAGDVELIGEVRTRLASTVTGTAESANDDLIRTREAADTALREGRFGQVIDLWSTWLLRAPRLTRDEERRIATTLSRAREQAGEEARRVAAEHDRLLSEGQGDAARDLVAAAVERLAGTGWEEWVRLRCIRSSESPNTVGAGLRMPTGAGDVSRALRIQARADELLRLRQFAEAGARLREAVSEAGDAGLRRDLEERALDVEAAAALLARVLETARAEPSSLSPLKLPEGTCRVTGATDDGLLVVPPKRTDAETRPLSALPGDAVATLLDRIAVTQDEAIAAAVVMKAFDHEPGYRKWMCVALGDEPRRLEASRSHARLSGLPLPPEGFVEHPKKAGSIITYDESVAIANAEKVAKFTTEYQQVLGKLESSKQAKQILKVAEAYAALEKARDYALELILDTEKYFYPYRGTGREAEYEKVAKEVDDRVKLVEAAWDVDVSADATRDPTVVKLLERLEEIEVEVAYLRGDLGKLTDRATAVSRYLDQKITVRTYWETDVDRRLIAYNQQVMTDNAAMETLATDPEREQVRVTNDYRIMFGHRRALRLNDHLVTAARAHSDDMARLGFFDHFSPVPGKRSPGDRTKLAGYPGTDVGENIQMGQTSPLGAHKGWCHSSGHHRNLLDKMWVEMGSGQSGRHWTQNFGNRSGDFGDFK